MLDAIKNVVLLVCQVPPEPAPPAGSPGSARVFRAAANFYKLSLVKWSFTQIGAILGILAFSMTEHIHRSLATPVNILEAIGAVLFLIQLPFTFFLVRLDFEMRWYIVTDRSLRIRHGVLNVREMTMTFANIQQMTIRQGPLQRVLGIADLQVRTAGGGDSSSGEGSAGHGKEAGESMHLGYFRGVDNAEKIRDLILERLRHFRDAGLGDPDDVAPDLAGAGDDDSDLLSAARELLAETQALRKALSNG